MTSLPHNLYRAAQVRELDRIAIQAFAIPGAVLMERAGRAAFQLLRSRWPRARQVAVFCGTGNNGGDGFVVAHMARAAGYDVVALHVGDLARLRGDAQAAYRRFVDGGGRVEAYAGQDLAAYQVLVDGLLGTGLQGPVNEVYAAPIGAINASGVAVLALDIPSGLNADTGSVAGCAVRAQATITFIGIKQGMLTGTGPDYCGDVFFDDLGVPDGVYARVAPAATHLALNTLGASIPPRLRAAHKGDFGHVWVVGGNHGMAGAALLAATAAARAGAGLVSVATRAEHTGAMLGARPELMCHGVVTGVDLASCVRKATIVAIGPGLGRDAWAQGLWSAALDAGLPLVVDADALNLLAAEPLRRDDWVLTPHPGEAARLLGCSSADVQADRFHALAELQSRYGGVVVLKGAGTLVGGVDAGVGLCHGGNPGMASAGMGDVLTGIVAGLAAQGLALPVAAALGVCVHAQAGDRAAQFGERGMLAGDVVEYIREGVNLRG